MWYVSRIDEVATIEQIYRAFFFQISEFDGTPVSDLFRVHLNQNQNVKVSESKSKIRI